MTSNKQKRASLQLRRAAKREKQVAKEAHEARAIRAQALKAASARGEVLVDPSRLQAGYFDHSDFMRRGTYLAVAFTCKSCGKSEIWTAHQQKWWYEIAKGNVFSTAILCRPCRRRERERQAAARRIHLEGVARKGQR
jgi:hypothetical protein